MHKHSSTIKLRPQRSSVQRIGVRFIVNKGLSNHIKVAEGEECIKKASDTRPSFNGHFEEMGRRVFLPRTYCKTMILDVISCIVSGEWNNQEITNG